MGNANPEKEHIKLWILEQERQKDRANALKKKTQKSREDDLEDKNHCSKCKKGFQEPKLVYVCPHCLNAIEKETKTGCRYWFGYLYQKDRTESVPQECVECAKVMECMLSEEHSQIAVTEISKWY